MNPAMVDSTTKGYGGVETAPLKLGDLRHILIRQEETIIFALIERAQFALNRPVYSKNSRHVLGLSDSDRIPDRFAGKSFLDFMLGETEQLHSLVRRYTAPDEHAFFPTLVLPPVLPAQDMQRKIAPNTINIGNKIMSIYEKKILPELSADADDGNYGSCAVTDIASLQALSKRIHFGKFIAEAKFQAETERYSEYIRNKDAESIMRELTKPDVEAKVIERVRLKASTYGRDPQHKEEKFKVAPELIAKLYKDWVMPLTKEVQVAYLLQRLDPQIVSFVGHSLASDIDIESGAKVAAKLCLERDQGKHQSSSKLKYSAQPSVNDVIAAVKCNKSDVGVIDLESTDFGVNRITLRSLIDSELSVVSEFWRTVQASAVACEDVAWPPKEATEFRVYGTREMFSRANEWISKSVPKGCDKARMVLVQSDGEAIESLKATKISNASICAIAIIERNKEQDLKRLNLIEIADADATAATKRIRSVVIQKGTTMQSGNDRSALAFTLSGREPGELSTALELFKTHEVNMVQIQSLPPMNPTDAFCFYVELDGHVDDTNVSTAVNALQDHATSVKILGSYMIHAKDPDSVEGSSVQNPKLANLSDGKAAQADMSSINVAFLGPEATYSHQAAVNAFTNKVSFTNCNSIESALKTVEEGQATHAVLPIENSTCGPVSDTIKLLGATNLAIVGEFYLPIHHQLLSNTSIDKVIEVQSKAQALEQCSAWIKSNLPNAIITPVSSSSAAVKTASQVDGVAAIGSKLAAELMGVTILQNDINDDLSNTTRFLVLSKCAASDFDLNTQYRTSFFAAPANASGLGPLVNALERRDLEVLNFISRPAPNGQPWQYEYFIDCNGHKNDACISEVLKEMQASCASARCLGSYPKHVN